MATALRRANNYLEPAELAALLRERRVTGRVSDALGRALLQIAGGVWDRFHFTRDRDDFVQDVAVHLLQRPLELADVQKHVFNYLTTCAIHYGMKLREKAFGDRRRFETHAAELLDAGRAIASTDAGD